MLDGLVLKLTAAAAPTDTVKLLDCTLTTVPSSVASLALAVRMYSPASVTDTPVKLATPDTAATLVIPLRTPVPLSTVKVTVSVEDVTVLPFVVVSWTFTTGCEANGTPPALAEGLVVNTRMLAASTSVADVHVRDRVAGAATSLQNEAGQYLGSWLQFASHQVSVQVLAMHLYFFVTAKPARVSTLR